MRKFTKLDNTVVDEGNLRKRPGLQIYGPYTLDTTELPAAIIDLIEYPTNLEFRWTEELLPTITHANAWTLTGAATAHAAVDDVPHDAATTYMAEADQAGIVTLGFANLSQARDSVGGVEIFVVGRVEGPNNVYGEVKVSYNDATTDYEIGRIKLTAGYDIESDNWQMVMLESPFNPKTGAMWTDAEIDGIRLSYELVDATKADLAILEPDGAGFHTGFSGAVGDIVSGVNYVGGGASVEDGSMSSTVAGTKQSVTVGNPATTFSSVDQVTIDIRVWRDTDSLPAAVRFYLRGSDATDRQIGSDKMIYNSVQHPNWSEFRGYDRTEIVLTTNPETDAAWSDAELDDIQIVVEHLGGGQLHWGGAHATVEGQTASTVEITATHIRPWGWDSDGRYPLPQLQLTSRGATRINNPSATAFTSIGTNITLAGIPPVKADHAFFLEKVWATNGQDQIIKYPDAGDLWEQLSAKPYGRCIESYGGRILLGDVTESSTRNAERIRWSQVLDGDDWSSSLSGQLDIHDTPGPFIAIKNYLSSCILYKEQGIYELIVQPDVIQPFRHYLRFPTVGCSAQATVQNGNIQGQPAHFFLGEGPSGLSVYAYINNQILEIGDEIRDKIQNTVDDTTKHLAFAVSDPVTNMYLLFLPTSSNYYPDECWAYHFPTETWRKWTFSQRISAAGIYTIPTPDPNDVADPAMVGRKTAVFASADHNLILWLNPDFHLDMDGPGLPDPADWSADWYNANGSTDTNPALSNIDMDIELELRHPEDRPMSTVTVHIWYRDRGYCNIGIFTSEDGGNAFTQQGDTLLLGSTDETGDAMYTKHDFDIDHAMTCTLSIREVSDIEYLAGDLDIEDIAIEFDSGGESAR
jgi:hypothetical protein